MNRLPSEPNSRALRSGSPAFARSLFQAATFSLLALLAQPTAAFPQAIPFVCQNGAAQTYLVPADVTQLYVVAAGGGGATTSQKKLGAAGALVFGTLDVEPGQTLNVVAGCAGRRAIDYTGGRGGAGYGRGGDGGSSAFEMSNGSGGGGGSAVLDEGSAPLLVAGGAGGRGGDGAHRHGGRGGKGSRDGVDGADGAGGSRAGTGGTSSMLDGAGGWRSAVAGSGGGGGGGYGGTAFSLTGGAMIVGGGGGGETSASNDSAGGGGGGGGTSFAAPLLADVRFRAGRGPHGDGFVFIAPHKPWKPTPSFAVFDCKKGRTELFTVPSGVEELLVVASGAGGGSPFNGTPAQGGARITGSVSVVPGNRLKVVTGCQGLSSGGGGKGFDAGANGIAAGVSGGGGGSSALLAAGGTPLIVAAGGSGGGPGSGAGGGTPSCAANAVCSPVESDVNQGDGTVLIMAVPSAAPTIPDPPVDVAAVAGIGQATVSFTAPADTGNSAITSYTVTATNDMISATGSGSPITVTGLAEGAVYAFTVTATNANGPSVPSEPSNTVDIPSPPSQPTDVTAVAGNAQATVSFGPPEEDGGSPVTSYTAISTPGGQTVSGSASPLTITGLTNGIAYTIEVRATNALGTGAEELSNAVTPQP